MAVEQNDNIILAVDRSWSNDWGIGIEGWILGKNGAIDEVEISLGGTSVAIASWHPRPDVAAAFPQYPYSENCGFVAYVPRIAEHCVTFHAKTQGKISSQTVTFLGDKLQHPKDIPHGGAIYTEFIKLVNENHLRVLEIGSRAVSPGTRGRRELFPDAFYTGFDYYPDENTDVVGDAHRLSQYFKNQRFDAIFSVSVLEHLAMPWVVAMEINKLLEIGGITFHGVPLAWPLHERPWDFWRFSDDGLKVLFAPPLGFEVIKSGLFDPAQIHLAKVWPGQEGLTKNLTFAGAAVLARKVADFKSDTFKWDVTLEEVLGKDSHYPTP